MELDLPEQQAQQRRALGAGSHDVHQTNVAEHNPVRRHSTLGYLSPIDYENVHRRNQTAA